MVDAAGTEPAADSEAKLPEEDSNPHKRHQKPWSCH